MWVPSITSLQPILLGHLEFGLLGKDRVLALGKALGVSGPGVYEPGRLWMGFGGLRTSEHSDVIPHIFQGERPLDFIKFQRGS